MATGDTPITMLLYSLMVIWFARVGHTLHRQLVRSWCPTKMRASLADKRMTPQCACLRREEVSTRLAKARLPENLFEPLLRGLQVPR